MARPLRYGYSNSGVVIFTNGNNDWMYDPKLIQRYCRSKNIDEVSALLMHQWLLGLDNGVYPLENPHFTKNRVPLNANNWMPFLTMPRGLRAGKETLQSMNRIYGGDHPHFHFFTYQDHQYLLFGYDIRNSLEHELILDAYDIRHRINSVIRPMWNQQTLPKRMLGIFPEGKLDLTVHPYASWNYIKELKSAGYIN